MRKLLFSLLLVTAVTFATADDDEIRNAERAWAAAVVANDYKTLETMLSTELIYAHSTGAIETKDVYLGKIAKGQYRYKGIDHKSITVKMYDNAAVAHSKVRMYGVNESGPFDFQLVMLHLWVKQGGHWMLAAHQTTKLP